MGYNYLDKYKKVKEYEDVSYTEQRDQAKKQREEQKLQERAQNIEKFNRAKAESINNFKTSETQRRIVENPTSTTNNRSNVSKLMSGNFSNQVTNNTTTQKNTYTTTWDKLKTFARLSNIIAQRTGNSKLNKSLDKFIGFGNTIENAGLGVATGVKQFGKTMTNPINSQASKQLEQQQLMNPNIPKEVKDAYLMEKKAKEDNSILNAMAKKNINHNQLLISEQLKQQISGNKNQSNNMYVQPIIQNNIQNENSIVDEYRDRFGEIELNSVRRELSNSIEKDEEKIAQNVNEIENPVLRKTAELAPSAGNSLFGAGLSAINPYVGATYFATSASGSYEDEARKRGMTKDQARTYGAVMGVMEGATEMVGVGKLLSGSAKASKGLLKEALKDYGINMLDNAIQEAIIDPVDEIVSFGVSGKTKYDYTTNEGAKQLAKDMIQDGFNGALSAGLTDGASLGISSCVNVCNKIENGQNVTQQELVQAYNDIQKDGRVNLEQKFKEEFAYQKDKLNQENNEQIRNELNKNGDFSNQLDLYKEGKIKSSDLLYLGDTPEIYTKIGLKQNPITLLQGKLKDIITQGKNETSHQHGISIDTLKQLPKALENPLNILKSKDKNGNDCIVVITDLADTNDRPIIASILINDDGQIGNIHFDTNRLTSAYGKRDYDDYMTRQIEEGNMLYDIDEGIIKESPASTRLQLPKGLDSSDETSSFINNSIPQNNEKINSGTITNNYMQNEGKNTQNKTLNPTEISNLKEENASTTPILPIRNYNTGNKQSSFFSNIVTDAKFLNEDLRQEMAKDENIRYYKGVTNAETLEKAYTALQDGGENETINWFSKDTKDNTAEDVAKGWILLKQYQDKGDYKSAVEVAKKMRDMGSNAGQTVQAYNILSRLTPEGMFYYAQSELSEAYNKMVEGKSKKWIEENADKFNLTPEDTKIIMDTMQEVATMEDGREKQIKLAEIQKLVQDKIPPTIGQSIKAWMRNSMLLNPKTLHRNILGNAVMVPVNVTSDVFSTGIDKMIAKKTGVRTTGITKEGVKGYVKGFGKGLYESYDDFRRGINTRDMEGNKFEIGEGKSFKDKGVGKALNRVDNFLNFALDAGDRPFYEASFINSINNQLVLNNTTEVTQDMIEIASTEALQRTWQDSNAYTSAVLAIRNILNGKIDFAGIHTEGLNYGLGDILIPFAKTPANLTKAIVDYSPVGLTKTLAVDARKFHNSLNNGQYSPQLQHKFVQSLGKGMAGSLLYVLAYGLAKSGIATGESDDDKDIKNFIKNSMGISSYSIKIGNKTFTYDWAQPIAVPLSIMTNYEKYSKDNPDASAIDKAIKSMNIGTEQLLEQSFMQSLNTVLNGNGTTLENLSKAVLDLPARAIPTFSKQIADMVDDTQRTTFEYGKPVQSSVNSVIAKVPFASKTLPTIMDTLGNEVKKYGGNNNWWNVFFNPANENKGQLSNVGQEIYNTYMQTGDTTIFPRVAPYYINNKGDKITMTAEQRNQFQEVSGQYVESTVNDLLNNSAYKKLNDEQKAKIISEVVSDSYSKAKYDVLNLDTDEYKKVREILKEVKPSSYYDYKNRTAKMKKDNDKIDVLLNSNYSDKDKTALYENYIKSQPKEGELDIFNIIKSSSIDINEYLKYKQQEFESDKKDDGTLSGETVKYSLRNKVANYLNTMKINGNQRLLLYAISGNSGLSNTQKNQLFNYVESLNIDGVDKLKLYNKFSGFTAYKDGTVKY